MNWMNFTIIEIQADRQNQAVNVQRVENVPVNVEHVFMIVPITIPSNLAGPNGQPVGKIVSRLISSGGAAVIVDVAPAKVLARIDGTNGISDPNPIVEADFEPEEPKSDDGPRVIKLANFESEGGPLDTTMRD